MANAAAPMSPIEQQAQAEIDPIIAALTAQENAQAARADAAIKGLTSSYAQQLAGINYGAPYAGAESQTAAVDAALRQALAGGGADLASGLGSELSALDGSSGAPAVQQAEQALQSQGVSAGNTRLASGSAALNQLISDAASARSYGQKMPGIAKLSGLQGVKQAEGNAQSAIASGTTSAESQLPTIVNEIRSAKQQARALASENAYRQAEVGLSSQRNQLSAQRNQISAQQGQERLGIEQQNANTSARRVAQEALNSNRSYSLSLSRLGIENKRLQMEALASEAKLKGGGYTPQETHNLQLTANSIASGASKHGGTFQQLMHTMALNDIPMSIAAKAAKLNGFTIPKQLTALQKTLGALAFNTGAITGPAAQTIVKLAHQYMGTPYQWGGESPKGFDCSGFAQFLYGKAGIKIPRTTYTQWQAGRAVPQGKLMPGDLVFFKGSDSRGGLPGHVGIYIGNGQMIDAPHTGADVRIESVANFGGYMGARRYGKG